MRKIVYYVATSLDGYICGPNEDISMFIQDGNGVEKYLNDLKSFDTVIMGRNTYEFGYKFGLEPGKPAYDNMNHYIFSNSMQFENAAENVKTSPLEPSLIAKLKSEKGSDIYLCGGGAFAGWLLNLQMIDILKIKLNPILLGNGVKLFENTSNSFKLSLNQTEEFQNGLLINSYQINY